MRLVKNARVAENRVCFPSLKRHPGEPRAKPSYLAGGTQGAVAAAQQTRIHVPIPGRKYSFLFNLTRDTESSFVMIWPRYDIVYIGIYPCQLDRRSTEESLFTFLSVMSKTFLFSKFRLYKDRQY